MPISFFRLLWVLCLCWLLASVTSADIVHTPYDTIPDFGATPTHRSVQDGPWSAPTTWDAGRVPDAQARVEITHHVLYDEPQGEADVVRIPAPGSLTFATNQPTQLLVTTLLVPGGTLTIGTQDQPVPAEYTATILIRDAPLQLAQVPGTVYDPAQYGHGVLVIDGTISLQGAPKTAWLRLADAPQAGATTVRLEAPPQGWAVGDILVLPDSRQLSAGDLAPVQLRQNPFGQGNIRRRQSHAEEVTVQALDGATVTLTAPLQWEHPGAPDEHGTVVLRPHIGNLTRNVVIASQHPEGTRGHVFLTGASAVSLAYARFADLGRTQAEPLDNTLRGADGTVTHMGTNQIGRYSLHLHHVRGRCTPQPFQYQILGVVVQGGLRWGVALHDSSYGLVQDSIAYHIHGAGFVTEDGSERDIVLEHNLAARIENATLLVNETEVFFDPLGREGVGFWFRAGANHLRGNVAAETREGIGVYTGSAEVGPTSFNVTVKIPSFPCADTTVSGQYTARVLVSLWTGRWDGNEVYSSSQYGIGLWNTDFYREGAPTLLNTTVWHVHDKAIIHKYANVHYDGLVVRNRGGVGIAYADANQLDSGNPRGPHVELSHFTMTGVDTCYTRIGQLTMNKSVTLDTGLCQSRQGVLLKNNGQGTITATHTYTNVRFLPLPGQPLRSFTLTPAGSGGDPNNLPKRYTVRSYQGNPADSFRLYATAQAPQAPAPASTLFPKGCPEPGFSNQQCWDKYKIATMMEVAPCQDGRPEVVGFTCPLHEAPPQGVGTLTIIYEEQH